eukprot:TRINITY_DN10941_c0_g1_i1.p1 TRINITY_DN10941_c0_g1~~TRINITY_DN10941_c0_g1_i1.p1  ORF type:complete len:308 (+),score=77.20 TRINITY_DN10941_c0_g1_i1:515-1438(+)
MCNSMRPEDSLQQEDVELRENQEIQDLVEDIPQTEQEQETKKGETVEVEVEEKIEEKVEEKESNQYPPLPVEEWTPTKKNIRTSDDLTPVATEQIEVPLELIAERKLTLAEQFGKVSNQILFDCKNVSDEISAQCTDISEQTIEACRDLADATMADSLQYSELQFNMEMDNAEADDARNTITEFSNRTAAINKDVSANTLNIVLTEAENYKSDGTTVLADCEKFSSSTNAESQRQCEETSQAARRVCAEVSLISLKASPEAISTVALQQDCSDLSDETRDICADYSSSTFADCAQESSNISKMIMEM